MTTLFRPLMTLIATLALVLAMPGQGFARAQPPASGLHILVICAADGGEAVVMVDSHGAPVAPDQPCTSLCPDCLAISVFALGGMAAAPVRTDSAARHATTPIIAFHACHGCSWAAARGPPNEV